MNRISTNWTCPVCRRSNTSRICCQCGFDDSMNYTRHPLPARLPKRAAQYYLKQIRASNTSICINGQTFSDTEQLGRYMTELFGNSLEQFEQFCLQLADEKGQLTPEVLSWLAAVRSRAR